MCVPYCVGRVVIVYYVTRSPPPPVTAKMPLNNWTHLHVFKPVSQLSHILIRDRKQYFFNYLNENK